MQVLSANLAGIRIGRRSGRTSSFVSTGQCHGGASHDAESLAEVQLSERLLQPESAAGYGRVAHPRQDSCYQRQGRKQPQTVVVAAGTAAAATAGGTTAGSGMGGEGTRGVHEGSPDSTHGNRFHSTLEAE